MSERAIWCADALLGDGWRHSVRLVLAPGGMIRSVDEGPPAEHDVQLHGITLPGMPNVHSHGFQRLMVGLTAEWRESGDSFWGWRNAMYGFANRVTPDQLRDCMAHVYAEMLAAGFTSCGEFHYLHHQPSGGRYDRPAEMSLQVLEAADTAGLPVTLLPVLYRVSGFDSPAAERHQLRFVHTLDDYLHLLDDCRQGIGDSAMHRLGVAPHSLRAVPLEDLAGLLGDLPDQHMPIHIHVAEQPAEVAAALEAHGARPVSLLLDHAPVDQRWCLVHATHMNESELANAAATGAVAGLCPTTEADLGDGFFETPAWLRSGGQLAIGSDSNLRISVSEELRWLEFQARLRSGKRQVLRTAEKACGRYLYESAARGGAQALGQPVGVLETGRRADLVELDADHPLLAGRSGDQWLESFVFGGQENMIRSVFAAGRQRVADGRHVDSDTLRDRYTAVSKALVRA